MPLELIYLQTYRNIHISEHRLSDYEFVYFNFSANKSAE